jgi:hypothetical protein
MKVSWLRNSKNIQPVVSKSNYSYKLVVAKYNENVDWIKHVDNTNVIIYDKSDTPIENSIPLKNIGREGETFLYHILQNYDNLTDYTIFVQGNPFDHMSNINPQNFQSEIYKLINEKPDTKPLFCSLHNEEYKFYPGLRVKEYYKFLFNEICPETIQFSAGGQYIIPKHRILQHPKSFYETLERMITESTIVNVVIACINGNSFNEKEINAWTLERMFYYICSDIKKSSELRIA